MEEKKKSERRRGRGEEKMEERAGERERGKEERRRRGGGGGPQGCYPDGKWRTLANAPLYCRSLNWYGLVAALARSIA